MSVETAEAGPITVDIWSDVACPWCYIGKRHFEQAEQIFADAGGERAVTVEYHSFELSPDTPVDFVGSDVDYLVQNKGLPRDQAQAMIDRVTGIAATAGLAYDLDHVQHTNTVKAHQVIHLAKAHGLQLEMKERLLKAYFVQGQHVGENASLAGLAAEIGLDHDEVLEALAEDRYLDAVRADEALAAEYGIQGVPFFVIDGKYGVSGAQPAAAFVEVLETVWGERPGAAAAQVVGS